MVGDVNPLPAEATAEVTLLVEVLGEEFAAAGKLSNVHCAIIKPQATCIWGAARTLTVGNANSPHKAVISKMKRRPRPKLFEYSIEKMPQGRWSLSLRHYKPPWLISM